jgi:hypothetical protein
MQTLETEQGVQDGVQQSEQSSAKVQKSSQSFMW